MKIASSSIPTPYGYCENLDPIALKSCAVCYSQVSNYDYLSNCKLVTAMPFSSRYVLLKNHISISSQSSYFSLRMANCPPHRLSRQRLPGLHPQSSCQLLDGRPELIIGPFQPKQTCHWHCHSCRSPPCPARLTSPLVLQTTPTRQTKKHPNLFPRLPTLRTPKRKGHHIARITLAKFSDGVPSEPHAAAAPQPLLPKYPP